MITAGCLYPHTGLDAIDMSSVAFGHLDRLRNRHNQSHHEVELAGLSAQSLAAVGSFHSVEANVQRFIHTKITANNKAPLIAALQGAAVDFGHTLAHYPQRFVAAWHCHPSQAGVHGPHQPSALGSFSPKQNVLALQHGHSAAAICQASIAKRQRPLSTQNLRGYIVDLGAATVIGAPTGTKSEDRQHSMCNVFSAYSTSREAAESLPRAMLRPTTTESSACAYAKDLAAAKQILAVPVARASDLRNAHLMAQALRKVKSCATLLLVYTRSVSSGPKIEELFAQLGPVHALPVENSKVLMDPMIFGLQLAKIIEQMQIAPDSRLVVLPPSALLQRDPFGMVESWDGVAVFMREPLQWRAASRCYLAWPHQLPLTATIDPWVAVGPVEAVARFLLARYELIMVGRAVGGFGLYSAQD